MSEIYFETPLKSTNVRDIGVKPRMTRTALRFMWRWAPWLTRRMILRLFFAPLAYRTSTEEAACLEQGEVFQFSVHDKIIHAWKWGQGPAVLMVHGWNGRGAQFHRFVPALVEAGYTAIAIDGPAHGDSTGRSTSYFEFTDTVRTLLTHFPQFNIQGLIGHSFGADAVINSLAKEGLALNTVCIAPVLRLRELLFDTFSRLGVPASIFNGIIGDFERRYGYDLRRDNPYRLLGHLRANVLIVHDMDDRTAPFGDSKEQSESHSHVTLHVTKGLGHRRVLSDSTVIKVSLDHLIGWNESQFRAEALSSLTA